MKETLKKIMRSISQNASGAYTAVLIGAGSAQQSPFMAQLFDPRGGLPGFFNNLFKAAIVTGAMLAVVRLGYAGFMYMMSDIWSNKEKAKGIIQEALLGLLLLIAIYLILNQINPNLLNLDILRNITPTPATTPAASSAGDGFCPSGQRWTGTSCMAPTAYASAPAGSWCTPAVNGDRRRCFGDEQSCNATVYTIGGFFGCARK